MFVYPYMRHRLRFFDYRRIYSDILGADKSKDEVSGLLRVCGGMKVVT